MPSSPPGGKQMVAFKIGARARKFAMEGCPIEGYEMLMTAIEEAAAIDPELHGLLTVEMEKYERRLLTMEEDDANIPPS